MRTSAGYLIVTPGVTGTDGIAVVSRLVVRALGPPSAGTAAPVEVLSVGDPPRPALVTGAHGRVALSGAAGRKLRFIGLALRRALARPRPSDVLCLHLRLSPVARLVTGARGRLAVFLHGIEAWKPLGSLERWALARADVLVANSEHTARRFCQANPGFAGRPIAVCHLGLGAADAIQSSDVGGRDGADPFALIVGRLAGSERYKGHDVLIDLWPRIRDEVPDAHLVVAGDGDDRARLEAKAAALGPPVRFLGRVSDQALDALYRDCAFFVMPSRDEGFGLVFLEAMRAGKACIGGAGAAAEVIEDGVTGLVVDATDTGEVEKAVVRLFLEPGTRARMGRAGAERLGCQFTEEHFRRRFRAILGLDPP
jgi:phosphatidylinositol alpha-1,6-mannosyltransferase